METQMATLDGSSYFSAGVTYKYVNKSFNLSMKKICTKVQFKKTDTWNSNTILLGSQYLKKQEKAQPLKLFFTDQSKVNTSAGAENSVIQIIGRISFCFSSICSK